MDSDTDAFVSQAYAIALRFLSKRAYAESRLRRTLGNLPKRFPQTRSYAVLIQKHISAVIARLIEEGLLDDYAFGNRLWDSYKRTHGFIACVQLLKRRGISQSAIDRIVEERKKTELHSLKDIIIIAEKKFASLQSRWKGSQKGEVKARNALFRFLAGRGYAYSEVQKIIKQVIRL